MTGVQTAKRRAATFAIPAAIAQPARADEFSKRRLCAEPARIYLPGTMCFPSRQLTSASTRPVPLPVATHCVRLQRPNPKSHASLRSGLRPSRTIETVG